MVETYTERLEELRDVNDLFEEHLESARNDHAPSGDDISIRYDKDATTIEIDTSHALENLDSFINVRYDSKRYSVTPDTSDLPESRHYQVEDVDDTFEIALTEHENGTAIYIEHEDVDGAYDEALHIADYLDDQ